MASSKEIQEKINQLQTQLSKLNTELEQAQTAEAEKAIDAELVQLAEIIHTRMCNSNHVDQCSWYYETWANDGYSREKYLIRARKLQDVCREIQVSVDDAIKIIDAMGR